MANQPDPDNGHCVLGIDAAWTTHNPSGVALVQRTAEGWQCLSLAPSYDAFIGLAQGQYWDPKAKASGSRLCVCAGGVGASDFPGNIRRKV